MLSDFKDAFKDALDDYNDPREITRRRVAKGFAVLERYHPGWWRHPDADKNLRHPDDVMGKVGNPRRPASWRRDAFVSAMFPDGMDETIRIGHGWASHYGTLGSNPVREWKRQIRQARQEGGMPSGGENDVLYTCRRCDAPRWNNETVRWVGGQVECDPVCPTAPGEGS